LNVADVTVRRLVATTFRVRVVPDHLLEHGAVARRVELVVCVAHAFDLVTEGRVEVLLVAEHDVDVSCQQAVDLDARVDPPIACQIDGR
jgi:hypothetical protein